MDRAARAGHGQLDLSYLARASDGERYFVTTMAIDPAKPFDEAKTGKELLALARGAFTLVKQR